jgi:DNA-binding XRE family transcriptional regulator
MAEDIQKGRNPELDALDRALADKFGAEEYARAQERAKFKLILARAVKQRRIEMNMDQKVLANKLHTSQQQLSRYEVGENSPTLDRFFEICELLDLEIVVRDRINGRELVHT